MKKELMEKPVLCVLDTRQIQDFMFRANSFYDTLGGSDLMTHILDDAILYALKHVDPPLSDEEFDLSPDPEADIPFLTSEKIRFQLIICTAGNALCLFRTGALAEKVIRKCSRYYLDHAYSLNLSAAVTEKTDNFGLDIFNLYKTLNAVKASGSVSAPMGALCVVRREHRTGEPVVAFDPERKDYVSRSSILRRKEAALRGNVIGMEEIRTTPASDGKEYLAVLHADGNNLGITIGRILQETPSYEKGIRTRRKINRNIRQCYGNVMRKALENLRAYYAAKTGGTAGFDRAFQLIHQAGDDVNVMCDASLAFPFAEFFYRSLEGSLLWEEGDLRIPMYVCTGIAFVTRESSFASAFRLAEQCCASAKKEAKKELHLLNGLAGNWIDFQVIGRPYSQELELLRDTAYTTGEGIHLMLRPYCLDASASGETYAFDRVRERVRRLRGLSLAPEIRNVLRESYMIGRADFSWWIGRLADQGLDLKELLGSPLYKDDENKLRAVWYDAVVLSDFLQEVAEHVSDSDQDHR